MVLNHFPNFPYGGGESSGTNFRIDAPDQYRMYKNTEYNYTGDLKFIHWTSIENLCSILNTGEFRLYNLIKPEDQMEFSYAADLLDLDEKKKEWIKKNYFTISFCKKRDLYNRYLWERYGRNFKGVAIEFSIIEDLEQWDRFFISDIKYDLPSSFGDFTEKWNELRARYNNAISLDFDIWKFAGFYKQAKYKEENEVRISTFLPYTSQEDHLRNAKHEFRIDGVRNRIVTYIPLKLWINYDKSSRYVLYDEEVGKKFSNEFLHFPKIKIENIYFGCHCGIKNEDLMQYVWQVQEMIHFQFAYRVELALNLFYDDQCNA